MAPSPTIRRLLKETQELSSSSPNPTPAFHAAPISDTNLHEWHFTLLGPPAPSPYAGGLYHGRITLPPSYPLKPPNFRFLTPSGRFEVNREICLSISGFHEETWMPAWGVRTALTALRSFMAEEGTAGQVGGMESSGDVRKRLAGESRGWKCEGCGRTNEQGMREWWEVCREKGVNVGEEVEVELEGLPGEMKLQARVGERGGKEMDKEPKPARTEDGPLAKAASVQPESTGRSAAAVPSSASAVEQQDTPVPSEPSSLQATSSGTPATQIDHERPISSLPLPPEPPAGLHAPLVDRLRPTPVNEVPLITIDRAIGVVFAALCLMILKKIFYPANGIMGDEVWIQHE